MLKLGNSNINKAYLGGTEIKKMYLGNDIVFDNTSSAYDADFQAWLDYNSLQGHYMTSDTVKLDAANQYVLDSKADGTWDEKDVFHLFAWNDLQMDDASLVCLKQLVKADVYGGVTYTVNGWEGNGVDGYINLNIDIRDGVTHFSRFDASLGVVIYQEFQNGGDGYVILGGRNIMLNTLTDIQRLSSLNNLDSPADLTGTGFKSINRNSSSSITLYNKDVKIDRTQTTSTPAMGDVFLFRNAAWDSFSDVGLSFDYIASSFTETENASIRTNLNTYLTSIGLTPYA